VTAPPALLVGGTLCDERLWGPMAACLAMPCVIAPPIAHGEVGTAADAALADAPARFVAVGFSLGGLVVLELLRRAPGRLAGAALIATSPLGMPADLAAERRAEVARAREEGVAAIIAELWPRYVATVRQEDAALKAVIVAMAEAVGVDLFAAQAELAISRPDGRAAVETTAIPLLILYGGEDGMVPPARWDGVALPARARFDVLPGVGHFVPLEAPDAAAARINAWAAGLA
jgi:pimeloyl-ACP methyl ester carboxylesterase